MHKPCQSAAPPSVSPRDSEMSGAPSLEARGARKASFVPYGESIIASAVNLTCKARDRLARRHTGQE